jgi:hypothetical protein
MKTYLRLGLVFLFTLSLASCVEQGGLKAGTATGKSMLKLIPATARIVVMVDIHRSMNSDTAQNGLKDPMVKQKYDEFVKMTGLDPMKDIYFLAVSLAGLPGSKQQEGALILNLKYNKDILLGRIKEKGVNLEEETYNGVTMYKGPAAMHAEGVAPAGAFLDDSNIVLGSDKGVRDVIDVFQKKADSVDKNAEMKKLFKAVNTSANSWLAVAIPQEMVKMAAEKNPMLKSLVGLTGLTLSCDYANKTLVTEIQGLGGTKEQNKALADMLTGLKGMGALVAAKEPVLGELLNTIEISSGANGVKVYSSIPGELMEKVQKVGKEKLGGLMQMHRPFSMEEKKEEKKEGAEIKK